MVYIFFVDLVEQCKHTDLQKHQSGQHCEPLTTAQKTTQHKPRKQYVEEKEPKKEKEEEEEKEVEEEEEEKEEKAEEEEEENDPKEKKKEVQVLFRVRQEENLQAIKKNQVI